MDPANSYITNPSNKVYAVQDELLNCEANSFDIEEERSKNITNDTDRLVISAVVNVEKLPFKDQSLDCYVSNLCMMMIDNHMNQLSEASRVLKSGSRAGFSIWGRKENTIAHTLPKEVMEKLGIQTTPASKDYFAISAN